MIQEERIRFFCKNMQKYKLCWLFNFRRKKNREGFEVDNLETNFNWAILHLNVRKWQA